MSVQHNPELARLHEVWNQTTGQNLKLSLCDYQREWGYAQFVKAGFTEEDLRLVIRYLQAEIKAGNRNLGAPIKADLRVYPDDLQSSQICSPIVLGGQPAGG